MTTVISARERARLLRQAREAHRTAPGGAGRAPRTRRTSGPATFAQEQLWFLEELAPGAANYNVPFAFTLDGPLDPALLAGCFGELARRHDSLRTSLSLAADGLTQQVAADLPVPFEVVDLAALDDPEAEAWRRCREAVRRPFALTDPPLWRAQLFRIGADRHLLVWVASHAVADGWSIGLLMDELVRLYRWLGSGRREPEPDPPRMQLLDYTHWQRERLQGEHLDRLYAYWDAALHGVAPLDFPYDHPRPVHATTEGRTAGFAVDDELAGALERVARRLGQTPFVVALAAYHALLARYCGHDDITVGTPVAGRDHPGFDGVFGSLVNTVALRVDCSGDPSFAELVARVAAVTRDALAHQELPFGKLVERLRPPRDGSYSPLLSTVFTYGSTPFAGTGHRLGDAEMRFTGVSNGTVRFDFELALDRQDDGWSGRLEYSVDLLDDETAQTICRRYVETLRRGLADPGTPLSQLLSAAAPAPAYRTVPYPAGDGVTVRHDLDPAPCAAGPVVRVPDPARPSLALAHEVRTDEDRYVLGYPVPGVRVQLRDAQGRAVPEGMAGTLVLDGTDGEVVLPVRCSRLSTGAVAVVGRQLDSRPPRSAPVTGGADTESAVRQVVTRAWQEALETEAIGPDDDFFAIGGHSVLGAKLVARLRDELRCDLSLIEFFQALTINELTALLVSRGARPTAPATDAVPPEELLARVEAMSDEEVLALLAQHDTAQKE